MTQCLCISIDCVTYCRACLWLDDDATGRWRRDATGQIDIITATTSCCFVQHHHLLNNNNYDQLIRRGCSRIAGCGRNRSVFRLRRRTTRATTHLNINIPQVTPFDAISTCPTAPRHTAPAAWQPVAEAGRRRLHGRRTHPSFLADGPDLPPLPSCMSVQHSSISTARVHWLIPLMMQMQPESSRWSPFYQI